MIESYEEFEITGRFLWIDLGFVILLILAMVATLVYRDAVGWEAPALFFVEGLLLIGVLVLHIRTLIRRKQYLAVYS